MLLATAIRSGPSSAATLGAPDSFSQPAGLPDIFPPGTPPTVDQDDQAAAPDDPWCLMNPAWPPASRTKTTTEPAGHIAADGEPPTFVPAATKGLP